MCSFRRKFGARLAELESQLEAAKSKAARLEKEKSKLTIEIETVMVNLDDVSYCCFNSHACSATFYTTVGQLLRVLSLPLIHVYVSYPMKLMTRWLKNETVMSFSVQILY